jgi:hypothetical protein
VTSFYPDLLKVAVKTPFGAGGDPVNSSGNNGGDAHPGLSKGAAAIVASLFRLAPNSTVINSG